MTEFRADLVQPETPEQAAKAGNLWDDDGPLGVTPFPTLDPAALQGTVGKIVNAVLPYTEAHPAPILAPILARFGAAIGSGAHVWADNRKHPARIYPLVTKLRPDGGNIPGEITRQIHRFLRASHGPAGARTATAIRGLPPGHCCVVAMKD